MDQLQVYLAALLEKYKDQPHELYCISNVNLRAQRLSTYKTFDSLFFEQKPHVMRILHQFKTQKHIYQHRGLAHHLTFF